VITECIDNGDSLFRVCFISNEYSEKIVSNFSSSSSCSSDINNRE
jgi:hypothetical protein